MRTYERTHKWISFQLDLSRFSWELFLLLGEARSKCEHLAGVPLRPATAEELHLVYLAKGVQGTTAIEGNTLTRDDVERQISGQLRLPPSKSYLQQEVANVLTALDATWEVLRTDRTEIHPPLIRALNKLLLADLELPPEVMPGEYRKHSVGVASYRAAPAEDCDYLMKRLCDWLQELENKIPPEFGLAGAIIRAVVAHLYIAWIHPFGDGNGRTARLIEYAILSRAGVPSPAAHLLSNHYNETRGAYYRELARASESGGDIVPFVKYAVQGLVDGLREQIALVGDQQLDVAWRNFVYEQLPDQGRSAAKVRCRNLLLDLSRQPESVRRRDLLEITARTAAAYAGKTAKTLSRDLNYLKKRDLIAVERDTVRARKERIRAFLPDRIKPSEVTAARFAGDPAKGNTRRR